MVQSVWHAVRRWTKEYGKWMCDPLHSFSMEEAAKDVAIIFKDSYSMDKKLNNNVGFNLIQLGLVVLLWCALSLFFCLINAMKDHKKIEK